MNTMQNMETYLMVDETFTSAQLIEFYDKLKSLTPTGVASDYLQGCHFVLMHLKRLIDGKNPFELETHGLKISMAVSNEV